MPPKNARELLGEIHSAERELLSCSPKEIHKKLNRYLKLKEQYLHLERRS